MQVLTNFPGGGKCLCRASLLKARRFSQIYLFYYSFTLKINKERFGKRIVHIIPSLRITAHTLPHGSDMISTCEKDKCQLWSS